jgi:hypothetical protein
MKYLALVFWSNEDEGYIAVAPDLPGARLRHHAERSGARDRRPDQGPDCCLPRGGRSPLPEPHRFSVDLAPLCWPWRPVRVLADPPRSSSSRSAL